jgi:hypothetical protein
MTDAMSGNRESKGHPLSGGMGIVLTMVILGAAVFLAYRTLTSAPIPDAQGSTTVFVCSETYKPFDYTPKAGEKDPVLSPYSKKQTGYPAEACYWTKDGKRKSNPTYVILNSRLNKSGDTICPDCGRVVVPHNPMPPATVPVAKE